MCISLLGLRGTGGRGMKGMSVLCLDEMGRLGDDVVVDVGVM